jgi:hypothetical protein
MANAEIIAIIIDLVKEMMVYMLPIIALLAGINYMVTWFMGVVFGHGRKAFRA